MDSRVVPELAALAVLVLCSALLTGAEAAYFSLGRARLKELALRRSVRVDGRDREHQAGRDPERSKHRRLEDRGRRAAPVRPRVEHALPEQAALECVLI